MNRGVIYLHTYENPEAALDDFNRAIELNPDNATTYIHRAAALIALEKFNQALKDFVSELREALQPHLEKALKIKFQYGEDKSASFYNKDLFGDHVVVEVHQWQKGKGSTDSYYMVPYQRAQTGFALGPPVEVVKEIHYVPKVPVTKGNGVDWANVL